MNTPIEQYVSSYPYNIWKCSEKAIDYIKNKSLKSGFFIFNGIKIDVYPDSNPTDIVEKYLLKMEIVRLEKRVS